jgi:hypothetical protein
VTPDYAPTPPPTGERRARCVSVHQVGSAFTPLSWAWLLRTCACGNSAQYFGRWTRRPVAHRLDTTSSPDKTVVTEPVGFVSVGQGT